MAADDHFPEWRSGGRTTEQAMHRALELFIRGLRRG
jgi:hypothetical protein